MIGIQFQYPLGFDLLLAGHSVQDTFHFQRHLTFGGEAARRVFQPAGQTDFLHALTQSLFDCAKQVFVFFLLFLGFFFFFLVFQPQVIGGNRTEFFFLVDRHHLGDEFVHIFGKVKDFISFVFYQFRLRQLVDTLQRVAAGIIDIFLALRHPADIFLQRGQLFLAGRIE